jgi:hypothetical protein
VLRELPWVNSLTLGVDSVYSQPRSSRSQTLNAPELDRDPKLVNLLWRAKREPQVKRDTRVDSEHRLGRCILEKLLTNLASSRKDVLAPFRKIGSLVLSPFKKVAKMGFRHRNTDSDYEPILQRESLLANLGLLVGALPDFIYFSRGNLNKLKLSYPQINKLSFFFRKKLLQS